MTRFLFIWLALSTLITAFAQAPSEIDRAFQEVKDTQITGGTLDGGLLLNNAAAGINHYFTCHGLLAVVDDPAWADVVRRYLDLYLREINKTHGWIDDVPNIQEPGIRGVSDSDDSYAGMMLLLAARFHTHPAGRTWWKANETVLKDIASKVLVTNQLPSGLSRVYSPARHFEDRRNYPEMDVAGRGFKIQIVDAAYLMDTCESYAGLKAFADVLSQEKDPSAKEFHESARRMAQGISGMFHPKARAFYVLSTDTPRFPDFYPKDKVKFYPHRAAQAWPQLFDVPLGTEQETQVKYNDAWAYLNAGGDRWYEAAPKDGSLGGFPWMSLGHVAIKRGERQAAKKQLSYFESVLRARPKNYEFRYIHEIGHAEMLRQLLR